MVLADCRRYIYYVVLDAMPRELVEYARRWIGEHWPGKQLLGWCQRYNRPVTYHTGRCYGYTPRPRSILSYLHQAARR